MDSKVLRKPKCFRFWRTVYIVFNFFVRGFEREYVWKRNDAKNLIESLIKDYPTGAMLTWDTNNPPELKCDYVYKTNTGPVKLILDGQQRITTLFMLMTGEIPPIIDSKDVLMNPEEILGKFCDRIGVVFSGEMLSWSRGARDTDGNWGKYWYKNVMNSTGFNKYVPKTEEVPEKYLALYEESYKLYQDLHKRRIR